MCRSVAKSYLTLWNCKDCSMPGFSVLCYLSEFAQIHVHWGGDAIYPSHSLPLPSPFAFNLSQHQGLFNELALHIGGQRIGTSASALVLPVNIQDLFPLGFTGFISSKSKGLSRVFSSTIWKQQFFGAQLSLWSESHIRLYMTSGKTIVLTLWTVVSKVMSLLF